MSREEPALATGSSDRPPPASLAATFGGAVLPLLGAFVGVAMLLVLLRGHLLDGAREGGFATFVALAATALGAVLVAVVMAIAARGVRVPAFAGVLFALLPWLIGVAGASLGMSVVARAIRHADVASRAAMLAMGTAEALSARLFGCALSAGLLGGASFALFLAAARSDRKTRFARVGAALLTGASAISASVVALSVVATAEVLGALARVDVAARAEMLVRAGEELGPYAAMQLGASVFVVLTAVAAAGLTLTRDRSVATIVSGVLLGGAVLGVLSLDQLGVSAAISRAGADVRPPWMLDPTVTPVVTHGTTDSPSDFVIVRPSGATHLAHTVPLEAAPLSALFGESAPEAEGDVLEEDHPAWLDDPAGPTEGLLGMHGAGLVAAPEKEVSVVLDGALAAPQLRRLIEGLAAGHVTRVHMLGCMGAACAAQQRAASTLGAVGALLPQQGSESADVLGAEVAAADTDPELWHVVVGAAGPYVPRARRGFLGQLAEGDPRGGRDAKRIYVSLADDATAQSLVDALHALSPYAATPTLVPGPVPGNPEQVLAIAAPLEALGGLFGDRIGDNFGFGGLGLTGTGGSGGTGDGTIGLGNIGTIGHGTAYGGSTQIRTGEASVRGSLSSEVIRRVVRRHINEVRYCYERELNAAPTLSGRVNMSFVIAADGSVPTANVQENTLEGAQAAAVGACIAGRIRTWMFPAPEGGGVVVVTYPFVLTSQ